MPTGTGKYGSVCPKSRPSKSLPSVLPRLAETGINNLKEYFDLEPIIFPNTFSDMGYSYLHPESRAQDINDAFGDSSIGAMFAQNFFCISSSGILCEKS